MQSAMCAAILKQSCSGPVHSPKRALRGEEYPISMENRMNRMPRISVDDVLSRVQLWKSSYAGKYGERSPGAAAALSG